MNLLKVAPFIKLIVSTASLCSASRLGKRTTPGKGERFTSSSQVGPQGSSALSYPCPCQVPQPVKMLVCPCHSNSLLIPKNIPSQNYPCVYKKIWFYWIFQYSSGKPQSSIICMRTVNTQPGLHSLSTHTHLCDSLMIILTDL